MLLSLQKAHHITYQRLLIGTLCSSGNDCKVRIVITAADSEEAPMGVEPLKNQSSITLITIKPVSKE